MDSDNHWKLIIHYSAGNLYWKDLEGRYQGCNQEFAGLLKLSSPDEIIGKTDYDLLPKEDAERIYYNDREIIKGKIQKTFEEIGKDKDNNKAYYLTKKTPLFDDHNNVTGLVGTSIDITKQKEAEFAKNEFIANMSHDLRTPFSGIIGISEWLIANEKDPSKKEYLGYILQSGERLLELFNEMIELMKIGSQSVHYTTFNIQSLLKKVKEFIMPALILKKLKLTINCPDKDIKTDEHKIEKILINLISNAIKFTNKGGVDINVSIDGKLSIVIQDTGIGIEEEKFNYIFEKFTKLKPSYKSSSYTGAGLGLHIVKTLVDELNGNIKLKSGPDQGSTFKVELPLW